MKNFPGRDVEFTKAGKVSKTEMIQSVLHMIGHDRITDLLVVSHGWNNDKDEANLLYQELLHSIGTEIERTPALNGRVFGVMRVFWPSKKFADEQLKPGGAASASKFNPAKEQLFNHLQILEKGFDAKDSKAILSKAKAAVKKMDTDANQGAKEFVQQITKLMEGVRGKGPEPEDQERKKLKNISAKLLLQRINAPANGKNSVKRSGGAASIGSATRRTQNAEGSGNAAGLGSIISGVFEGARDLLNFATYYQMKERAGNVGQLGLAPALMKIKKTHPNLRLHLIGHSFGGRLVSAATAALDKGYKIDTLVLLQAAFSHYGFAQKFDQKKDGLFRPALSKISGPIVITHTHNDEAVGKAYAIASRIAWQTGSALGKKNDLYGGIGANGAQKTGAIDTIPLTAQSKYVFQKNKVYNLLADTSIRDHSDVRGPEVGRAIAAAIFSSNS
jgi:hypothetical protein